MKKYQSHKIVEAARIVRIEENPPRNSHNPLGQHEIEIDDGTVLFRIRHPELEKAQVGDYYVVYGDGYTSRSPAKAFEEGYTELVTGYGIVEEKVGTLYKYNTFDELEKLLPPLLASSNDKRVNWTFLPHGPKDKSDPLGQCGYVGYTEAVSSSGAGVVGASARGYVGMTGLQVRDDAVTGVGINAGATGSVFDYMTDPFSKYVAGEMARESAEIEKPKAPTGPRVTLEDIHAAIASEHYFTAQQGIVGSAIESGAAVGDGSHNPLNLLTFCVLVMRNGYTVTGKSACVSAENFDANLGRKYAHEDAIEQCWPLFGFALKDRMFAEKSKPMSYGEALSIIDPLPVKRYPFVEVDGMATEDITLNRLRKMARDHEADFPLGRINHFIITITDDQIEAAQSVPGRVLACDITNTAAERIVGRAIDLYHDVCVVERFWFLTK